MTEYKIDSIGFDLDGTLWDGTASIAEAWQLCMQGMPDIRSIPTADELKTVMGLPITEILRRMFPYLSQSRRDQIMEQRRLAEADYISTHGGTLFEPLQVLQETFSCLSKQYRLYIVSNCQEGYIEAFLRHYALDSYFCDWECWGATGLSKGENIRLVMERNNFQHSIYVGDTKGDFDAASLANVPFVYASYGFGQVEAPVTTIQKLSDLTRFDSSGFLGVTNKVF